MPVVGSIPSATAVIPLSIMGEVHSDWPNTALSLTLNAQRVC